MIIERINDYEKLHNFLIKENVGQFQMKVLSKTTMKINVTHKDEYRKLTKALNEQTDKQWYSYENKQKRPIRVL